MPLVIKAGEPIGPGVCDAAADPAEWDEDSGCLFSHE